MTDEKGLDDKVVCIPCDDPLWNHMDDLDDLHEQLRNEIEHFFGIYKQLEGHEVRIEGWRSRAEALEVIERARDRHARQHPGD